MASSVRGRLQLVLLRVTDLERSAEFYRDLVGIPLEPGDNRRPGDPWIGGGHYEYSWREGGYLHFSIFAGSGQDHTANAHLGFEVEDLDSMHGRLVDAGVPVLHGPRIEPWGMVARYRDPDGNVLELVEQRPGRDRG